MPLSCQRADGPAAPSTGFEVVRRQGFEPPTRRRFWLLLLCPVGSAGRQYFAYLILTRLLIGLARRLARPILGLWELGGPEAAEGRMTAATVCRRCGTGPRGRTVLRFCGSLIAQRAAPLAEHRLALVLNQNGAVIVLGVEGW